MDANLPPLGPHDHPEPQTMVWSELELRAIRAYASSALAAQAAELQSLREALAAWDSHGNTLAQEVQALWADAERYRWLRDVSVPPHNFYLSVPVEFDGVRFTTQDVDAAIDAARAALKEQTP